MLPPPSRPEELSSKPEELHLRLLTEPYVSLSTYTALRGFMSTRLRECPLSGEERFILVTQLTQNHHLAASPTWLRPRYRGFNAVGSEVAHLVSEMLATVRRPNCTCGFPACSFHEDSCFRDAIEWY